jgi:hypothetical protein
MFDRLKKAFASTLTLGAEPAKSGTGRVVLSGSVAAWAEDRGFIYLPSPGGKSFTLTGLLAGKPMRLERGRSSRDYIRDEELRARSELGLNQEISVLVISRALKDALEKRAYQMYTDTLQTTADPNLPEEMRWLSMYREVGWDLNIPDFWERYAVLADDRDHAVSWLTAGMANMLMSWPQSGPDHQVPFLLMLMRGKAYLRMQFTPANMPTLDHATTLFSRACESAVARLSPDISLE